LKARCPLTVTMSPDDYKISGEDRLFQRYFTRLKLVLIF
jgi:hypothetical protein